MNILIVEDFRAMAKGFSEVLRAQGHQVQCVVGFSDLETLAAVDIDGQKVSLTAESFDFALVDGQLEQFNGQPDSPIQGPAVVELLVKAGVKCFGISTENELNGQMLANGAVVALNKAIAFIAFVNDLVTVEQAIASDSVALQRIDDLRANASKDEYKPMRRKADEIVARHL